MLTPQVYPCASNRITRRRSRLGKVLAECILALALSAIAVPAMLSLSRSAMQLTSEAVALSLAGTTASSTAERATLAACATHTMSGSSSSARVTTNWNDNEIVRDSQVVRSRDVTSAVKLSPLSIRDSAVVRIQGAGLCPW